MIDYDKLKQNTLARSIAAFDSIVISCREQQIALGKLLAKELELSEKEILYALKESSLQILKNNGLDY